MRKMFGGTERLRQRGRVMLPTRARWLVIALTGTAGLAWHRVASPARGRRLADPIQERTS